MIGPTGVAASDVSGNVAQHPAQPVQPGTGGEPDGPLGALHPPPGRVLRRPPGTPLPTLASSLGFPRFLVDVTGF